MTDLSIECLDPRTSDERLRALAIIGEDDTLDVCLESRSSSTLYQIKIIRTYFDLGLKEAMQHIDNLPQLLNQPRPIGELHHKKIPQRLMGLPREKATELQRELQFYTATTTLHPRVFFHPTYSRLVAQNPALSEQLYEALMKSADEETRKHLARNPAAPKDAWLKLAELHPEEALQNPALSLWLMEDPSLVNGYSLPFALVRHALRSPEAPQSLCRLFLANSRYRREIAEDAGLLPVWIELLSGDEDAAIRFCITHNKSTPMNVLRRLLLDNDPMVRAEAKRRLEE